MMLLLVFNFLSFSILSAIACKNSTTIMIDRFGTNLQPKSIRWFVSPARWMRKVFKITKWAFIPRYLYFELILSLIFAILGPIYSIAYIFSGCDSKIARFLLAVHGGLIIINTLFFAIMTAITKKI